MIAWVDEDLCVACGACIDAGREARSFDEERKVVTVNEALCEGCGSCVVACAAGAAGRTNLANEQLSRMVEVILAEREETSKENRS